MSPALRLLVGLRRLGRGSRTARRAPPLPSLSADCAAARNLRGGARSGRVCAAPPGTRNPVRGRRPDSGPRPQPSRSSPAARVVEDAVSGLAAQLGRRRAVSACCACTRAGRACLRAGSCAGLGAPGRGDQLLGADGQRAIRTPELSDRPRSGELRKPASVTRPRWSPGEGHLTSKRGSRDCVSSVPEQGSSLRKYKKGGKEEKREKGNGKDSKQVFAMCVYLFIYLI